MWILSTLLCGYVMSSYVALRNPAWLHKRKNKFRRCVHISHRGGAAEAYENTMLAFKKAVTCNDTDMLELDCHLTMDKVVVVAHDAHLRRVSDCDRLISNCNFSDLPKMKAELPIDFMPGKTFCDISLGEASRTIPTLESIFQAFPETDINIDIKVHDPELIGKVSELVKSYKRESKTVWGSMRYNTTELCYKTNPNMGLMFSFRRVITILLLYYTGLLPFVPVKETHFEIPKPSLMLKLRKMEGSLVKSLLALGLDKILLNKKLFDHLKARGIHVYIWVLNSNEEFEEAMRKGVSGVMTDVPKALREYLNVKSNLLKE